MPGLPYADQVLRRSARRVKTAVKRVGIYSGTFDPVHDGHVAFAEAARQQGELDKVFFMVEPRPRRKQGVKNFEHRNRMVELATRRRPGLGNIVLEQQRFSVEDTLPVLQARFKGAELYLLIGDDFLSHLGSWPRLAELAAAVRFVIGLRGTDAAAAEQQVKDLQKTTGVRLDYQLVPSPRPRLTSSGLRRAIKRGQLPDGLDKKVQKYIQNEGLYGQLAQD